MMKQILSFLILSSVCFADDAIDNWNDEAITQIITNKNICIERYENGKIYLKPDRIFPTEKGLYLNLNDQEYLFLSNLNSDAQGCFIPIKNAEIVAGQYLKIFNTCPGCQQEYFLTCKNPNCPLKQQRKEREEEKERKKQEDKEKKKKK